jgi:hypothetical protein
LASKASNVVVDRAAPDAVVRTNSLGVLVVPALTFWYRTVSPAVGLICATLRRSTRAKIHFDVIFSLVAAGPLAGGTTPVIWLTRVEMEEVDRAAVAPDEVAFDCLIIHPNPAAMWEAV